MSKNAIVLVIFLLGTNTIVFCQSEFGIKGGINNSSFYSYFSKTDYESDYKSFYNYTFSIFYKEQIKETQFFGFELENKALKSTMELYYNAGHASFYHNVTYDLNMIIFYFVYEKSLFSNGKIDFRLNISPYLGYMIKSYAKGTGWNYEYVSDIDTNGNNISYLIVKNWHKDEKNTNDLNKFNIGARLGLNLILPLSERLSFFVNNTYCFGINNILKIEDARYTGLRSIELKIGLHYYFDDKTLKIWNRKE